MVQWRLISIYVYQECYLLVRMSMQINLQHVFKMSTSPNACMHRDVSCIHVRCSVRQSWCPSELQNFVELGVKINDACYPDVLLTQKLLPVIRQISGNEFVFQQLGQCSSTPCSWDNELLRRETPDFISPEQWPPNSPDLNPVDYKIWATMQQRVYQIKIRNVDELRQRLLNVWSSIEQLRRHRRIHWPVACAM